MYSSCVFSTCFPHRHEKTGEWKKALEGYEAAANAAVSTAHARAIERAREERDRRRTGDADSFGTSAPPSTPSQAATASPSKAGGAGAKEVAGSSAGESSTDDMLSVPEPRPPFDLVERQLACLDALGQWQALHSAVDAAWPEVCWCGCHYFVCNKWCSCQCAESWKRDCSEGGLIIYHTFQLKRTKFACLQASGAVGTVGVCRGCGVRTLGCN